MQPRDARPTDLAKIVSLLAQAELPSEGVAESLATFWVAGSGSSLAGVVGLEVRTSGALLRSLAVDPSHRRRRLATRLCDHLESEAARRGIAELFLLTETAESFFARRGYAKASRADAPPDIAATSEFRSLCPQSAVFMRRAL